jgi:hypothetical membrane protein
MNNIQTNPWLISMPRLALWLFILLNIIAMLFYPGSTYLNHLTTEYSFTQNFLSDLGRTLTFSKNVNFLSSQLFNTSLIVAGVIFSLFYLNVHKVFNSDKGKTLALIGSIFGFFGGISLAGVGLTPSDLYLNIHILCANWLFRFMFMASLFYTAVIFRHPKFEDKYASGYLIFTFSILLYILISELGPDPKLNLFALKLQVVSQKMILLIFMASIYIQTLGLQKLYK